MTLQQTFLTNIESELHTRFNLAHVSATAASEIVWQELIGAKAMYETALAMGDAAGAHYQRQRGAALKARYNALVREGK